MTPLEERFRARLDVYKQQKSGISRDKNLKKKLNKLDSESNFQQQRKISHAKVKNIGAKFDISRNWRTQYTSNKGGVLGGFLPRGQFGRIGIEKAGPTNYRSVGGGLQALAKAKRWTTSGWQETGAMPKSYKAKEQKKKPSDRKWRLMDTYGSGMSENPFSTRTK